MYCPKRIQRDDLEQTFFIDISISDLSNSDEYSSLQKVYNIKSNKQKQNNLIEKDESSGSVDKDEYYKVNYDNFCKKKLFYIELIENLLERTDLNLNETKPDLSYIVNKYKSHKKYSLVKETQCQAYTNSGFQCSRKTDGPEIFFCGIHKKKQSNGTIHTGFFKK